MSGNSSRVRVTGPLVPYADGFGSYLEARGYRPNAVADQVRLLAHVSRWLAGQNLDVGDLTSDRVEAFLAARRSEGYVLWLSTKGVAPLLTHLRGLGAAPMAAAVPRSPIGDLLAEYRRYLLEERGIAPASAVSYTNGHDCSWPSTQTTPACTSKC